MAQNALSSFNLEHPAPEAVLAPGRHEFRGWVWPKSGGHFCDVRARVGDSIFPGVHGFPRADLAAHFQTGRRYALAEFHVVVALAPDTSLVVFEVLEIEGRWTPFATAVVTVDTALPPVDVPPAGDGWRWHDFTRGLDLALRARVTAAGPGWDELIRTQLADTPYPRDLLRPTGDFRGFIDEPAVVGSCKFGRLLVLGHLFHTSRTILRLLAGADLQALHPLQHGQPSPGIAEHYREYPSARHAQFHGWVDVPAQLPNPVAVRIYAELEDGSLHLVYALRTRWHDAEAEKFAYPRHAATSFERALAAWHRAIAAHRIAVFEDAALTKALEQLRTDYAVAEGAPAKPVAPLQPPPAAAPAPRQVMLVSHNLNLEGAPLFLLDYAEHLASRGVRLTVVTPEDGALRGRFEACGARIQVVDAGPFFAAKTPESAREQLARLGAAIDFADCDLVVANTFTTCWAVHAAQAAGRRTLLYVHESTTPASFYRDRMSAAIVALSEQAFVRADAVSFTTQSTRRYHLDYGRTDHHHLTPGWVDVARIDRWRAANPRETLRERFSLRPGELLVTNVGTVSDRKGQHTFVRAIDLLWRRDPELAARTRFILLGGRHTLRDDQLRDLMTAVQRPNIEVHAETADYLPYFAAADLTACSSHEESSPRVVLEAMACQVPQMASAVHGVPEFVRPDLEALLVPAGDTVAWCEGLIKLLRSPGIGRELAARARARVVERFEATAVLPRHFALAASLAGPRP